MLGLYRDNGEEHGIGVLWFLVQVRLFPDSWRQARLLRCGGFSMLWALLIHVGTGYAMRNARVDGLIVFCEL